MSNTWFRFKQFAVEQDQCAMKVTTDACIQGAWTPLHNGVGKILDIGTGTGLLALMLAQRDGNARIDALEIDSAAATQARQNVAASPWSNRISIITADAREYVPAYKYDLIISNPPFFIDSLLSDNSSKNVARHTLALTQAHLLDVIDTNLDDEGYASILLPHTESILWERLLHSRGWYVHSRLLIRHTPAAQVKRVVGIYTRKRLAHTQEDILTIKDEDGVYTNDFSELLRSFYLHL